MGVRDRDQGDRRNVCSEEVAAEALGTRESTLQSRRPHDETTVVDAHGSVRRARGSGLERIQGWKGARSGLLLEDHAAEDDVRSLSEECAVPRECSD